MHEKCVKPLGHRAYGSIGHLSNSRLGSADKRVPHGQEAILTEKKRDAYDFIWVEEKIDGSCCAVARIDDSIVPMIRAGYPASTSPYPMHWLFGAWVAENANYFHELLNNGERMVGEWIAQAHGTLYRKVRHPFIPFDIFTEDNERMCREDFMGRLTYPEKWLQPPLCVHMGEPISVTDAWTALISRLDRAPMSDMPEGLVYRCERGGKVDFLAKWVAPYKEDGKYLPEVSGCPEVWNWGPKSEE